MPDNPLIVELLVEYALEESVTRPEVGRIIGKTFGQVSGIHNRHKDQIGPWPKLNPLRRKNRKCQWPIGIPGTDSFHLCGKERKSGQPLMCEEHVDLKWVPQAKVLPMLRCVPVVKSSVV